MSLTIVGLGNPGLEYSYTRHNLGFMVLDNLATKLKIQWSKCSDSMVAVSTDLDLSPIIGDQELLLPCSVNLMKPLTYMNLSGKAVATRFRNRPDGSFNDVCIVYDDFNINLGQFRWRDRGSSGGHRGMESIINSLGTQDIPRYRIGIGPLPPSSRVEDYVLSDFNKCDQDILNEVIGRATYILALHISRLHKKSIFLNYANQSI